MFFGVEESNEDEQQARWLDRRKRLAVRKYGSLKEECLTPATTLRSPRTAARQLQLTSAYASQVSVSASACLCVLLRCYLPLANRNHAPRFVTAKAS